MLGMHGPPQDAQLATACAHSKSFVTLRFLSGPRLLYTTPRLTNVLNCSVNATETLLALAMVQKAGVPSNKVIVGVSSYGRSFHMAQAGCTGPDCQFTGDRLHSEAAKGECTDTAGYISNAEIEDIIAKGGNIKTWSENSTDYLVYNDVEWVSYMSPITKSARQVLYSIYGFGGTTDWAIDLQSYIGDSNYDNPGDIDDMEPRKDCDKTYGNLDDIDKDADSVPDYCLGAYILDALAGELEKGISDYDDICECPFTVHGLPSYYAYIKRA